MSTTRHLPITPFLNGRPTLEVCQAQGVAAFFKARKGTEPLRLTLRTLQLSKKIVTDYESNTSIGTAWPSPVQLPPALQGIEYSPMALKARAKVVNLLLDNLAQRAASAAAALPKANGPRGPVLELVLEAGMAADLSGALIVLLECTGEDEQVGTKVLCFTNCSHYP